MYCERCGHNNEDGVKFCNSCGSVLADPAKQNGAAPTVNSDVEKTESKVEVNREYARTEGVHSPMAEHMKNDGEQGQRSAFVQKNPVGTYYHEKVNVPPQQQQHTAPVYHRPPMTANASSQGLAVAALVCGICSICSGWGFILGILGIVFGCIARNKGNKSGMALAGIICGAVGIVLSIVTVVSCVVFLSALDEIQPQYYNGSNPFFYY